MTDHRELFDALKAPFAPDAVSWRVGSTTGDKKKGMALAFIDARDVMDRLDAVVGPAGWERRHPHVEKTTTCELTLILPDGTRVTKSDGAGDTDVEAEKGSLSDSFKRAAVNWGIGRYLYDLPSPWVELEAAGRSYKIAAGEMTKLRKVLVDDARRTGIRQPEPPPADEPKVNLAVTAAMTAITVCDSVGELKAWHMKNAEHLATLNEAEQDEIARHFKARAKAVAPLEDEAFRGGDTGRVAGNGRDVPQNDFGIAADEIPY